jgi:oxygen-independent coproporphyrinogen-3 oxidase
MMIKGLYLHIPFCSRRCFYCDFNTYEGLESLIPSYVDALVADMQASRDLGFGLHSLYFGGGTPSLLEPSQVALLIQQARLLFKLPQDAEVTLEANPGTVSLAQFQALRAAGVNRLSFGFQAAQREHLQSLGRIHDVAQSAQAWTAARGAGFDNCSLDLMFGLPGQDEAQWLESLNWALGFQPEHISFYGLTIEKGTRFHQLHQSGQLPLPDDEVQARMYETGIRLMAEAGLAQYEISNFARPGRRSRHNQLYWKNEDTLGLGAGAWSYVGGRRYCRVKSPQTYIHSALAGKAAEEESEVLDPAQARSEAACLGLRQVDGIDLAEWQVRTGSDWYADFAEPTRKYAGLGLLETAQGRVKLTSKGLTLANEVFCALL